jgi:hypothetical protein
MSYNALRFDYCSEEGARRLADQIAEYWRARGYQVRVELVCERKSNKSETMPMWHVRTDLIAGRPRMGRQ